MSASDPRVVRVSVEINTDDLRRHAEIHSNRGQHGVAHVLFTAAQHIEAGGDLPAWIGTPVTFDSAPADDSLRPPVSADVAWDQGVQWARDQIKEYMPARTGHDNTVIQPHYDALDAVPGGLGYSGYNAHITWATCVGALDSITPTLNPPPGYEPDDDPNPYRGDGAPEATNPASGADQ